MADGTICELGDRGVIRVSGEDAQAFLQGLVTCDIDTLESGAYGALLTPQGRIIFDFLITMSSDFGRKRYLLDLDAGSAAAAAKRLAMYKLRAKVEVADVSDTLCVIAAWGDVDGATLPPHAVPDPRLAALGLRAVVARDDADAIIKASGLTVGETSDYHAHRVSLGVPHGGSDFAFDQTFPHDADMDGLNGVAFKKGCYVGQEVVSRVHHRGTARRRIVQAAGAGALPGAGTDIMANGKSIGTLGSTDGANGLALVRIDRAAEAQAAGVPILADGVALTLSLPAWANFTWPEAGDEAP
ncbi:folate-binding protein YgfZ [Breoghania sp. L-A4]|uniref:CAF17-like 4Fe-4S cluster assembly/insertion protein YgfZ n=1 Tax=Breoghania sp. L-A4 TaxID=2304600 RepID=UPI000E35AD3C|nr:folate-binding protein YgfZ [Breoghania sp. L-A4]AXS39559.1 folate-binding protein [Breoghania sp. L-A4]